MPVFACIDWRWVEFAVVTKAMHGIRYLAVAFELVLIVVALYKELMSARLCHK